MGFVVGGVYEFLELGVGDLVGVEVEAADGDFVDGALLGVVGEFGVFWSATGVGGTLDQDHAGGRFGLGLEEGDERENEKETFHEAWIYGGDTLTTEMATTKFRPCIDLHEGKVKQIVGGTLDDEGAVENFVSEKAPSWYAEKFGEDDLRGGHVIKLGPGNDAAAREALGAWRGGLQIGGGITLENAAEWLEAGASEVIVTSWLFDEAGNFLEDRLAALVGEIGAEKIVLDLSCRQVGEGWKVAMNRWQTITEMAIDLETVGHLAKSCGEFLIHAADV